VPIYKHRETGNTAELSRDYVKAFPEGVWTLVEEEGPNERSDRELREALENKVTVENADGTEAKPETAAQKRTREKAEAETAAVHPPAATIPDQEGAK
jgi:hypothetical protein